MPKPSAELSALVGSRICHDLISPIGAIGNGLELLQMSGAQGPEIALISESVENANARVRFFRMAFGAAPADQRVSRREVCAIFDDLGKGGRIALDWRVSGDAPREAVQLAFLAMLCCETALVHGGQITITHDARLWRVHGSGEAVRLDQALWTRLKGVEYDEAPAPAQVQFELLPMLARTAGVTLDVVQADRSVAITF